MAFEVRLRTVLVGGVVVALAIAGVALGGELKRNTRTITIPNDGGGQAHFASVDCPPRTKATGGGGEVTEIGHQDASYPSGAREWTAAARSASLQPEDLTVHVICLKKGAGKLKRTLASSPPAPTTSAQGTLLDATATCPTGTKVIGGGLEVDPEDALAIRSFPSGKRTWTAESLVFIEGEVVTAHVICVKGRRVKRRSETERLPDDGQVHSASAKCPKGTKATGGGLEISDPTGESAAFGSFPSGKRTWTGRGKTFPGDDAELTAHVLCLKKQKK